MNLIVENDAALATEEQRSTLLIAYVLHIIGPFTAFVLNVAGLILNHIKAATTTNHFIRSHHSWMLRTFWWSLLWSIISGVLCLILIGYLGLLAVGIWWIYRVVRGLINYSERLPMPV